MLHAGSLGWKAYVRFGIWLVLSLLVYVFYGVHSASDAQQERVLHDRSGRCEPAWPGSLHTICTVPKP